MFNANNLPKANLEGAIRDADIPSEHRTPRRPGLPAGDHLATQPFESSWANTAQLGAAPMAGKAATAHVSTSDIPEHEIPLPDKKELTRLGALHRAGSEATVDSHNELTARVAATSREQLSANAYLGAYKGDPDDHAAWRTYVLAPVPENPFWNGLKKNAPAAIAADPSSLTFPLHTSPSQLDVLPQHLKTSMLEITRVTAQALKDIDSDPAGTGQTKQHSYPQVNWTPFDASDTSQREAVMRGIYQDKSGLTDDSAAAVINDIPHKDGPPLVAVPPVIKVDSGSKSAPGQSDDLSKIFANISSQVLATARPVSDFMKPVPDPDLLTLIDEITDQDLEEIKKWMRDLPQSPSPEFQLTDAFPEQKQ